MNRDKLELKAQRLLRLQKTQQIIANRLARLYTQLADADSEDPSVCSLDLEEDIHTGHRLWKEFNDKLIETLNELSEQ